MGLNPATQSYRVVPCNTSSTVQQFSYLCPKLPSTDVLSTAPSPSLSKTLVITHQQYPPIKF